MKAIAGFGAFICDTLPLWVTLFCGALFVILWWITPPSITTKADEMTDPGSMEDILEIGRAHV